MKKYRQTPDPPAPRPLRRESRDQWGKPHISVRGSETELLDDMVGHLQRHTTLAEHDRTNVHEAKLSRTESCAAFFKHLDDRGATGYIVSRGRRVGFVR